MNSREGVKTCHGRMLTSNSEDREIQRNSQRETIREGEEGQTAEGWSKEKRANDKT